MGTNWIHIQDGTSSQGNYDLLITSDTEAQLGQVIAAEGKVVTNKDFGSGYAYKVLIENAKIKIE
jgi:poly(3-hydroxyalkanoate) synthetase